MIEQFDCCIESGIPFLEVSLYQSHIHAYTCMCSMHGVLFCYYKILFSHTIFQIASCEICSAGLGAKRKSKPPGQKRDIPRNGPPEPPRKRGRKKFDDPEKFYDNPLSKSLTQQHDHSNALDLTSVGSILTSELEISSAMTQMVGNVNQQQNSDDSKNQHTFSSSSNTDLQGQFISPSSGRHSANSMETAITFHPIFTTIEDEQVSCVCV